MTRKGKKRSHNETSTVGKPAAAGNEISKSFKKKKQNENQSAVLNGDSKKVPEVKPTKGDQKQQKKPQNVLATNTPKKVKENAANQQKAKEAKKEKVAKPAAEKMSPEQKKTQLLQKLEAVQKARAKKKLKKVAKRTLVSPHLDTPDALKQKIKEIENRENLSKTARRKLAILTKKLKVLEGTPLTPETKQVAAKQGKSSVFVVEENVASKAKKGKLVQQENKQLKAKGTEQNVQVSQQTKKKGKMNTAVPAKANVKDNKDKKMQKVEDDDDDDDDEDDEDDEDESDEDLAEDSEEAEDEVEAEEEEDDDDDDEDDDEDEEDEEEEDEEDEDDEVSTPQKPSVQTKNVKEAKEQEKKGAAENNKKKRYVLFVGKLPEDVTEEAIKKHFETKCSDITSIRIPKQYNSDKNRGFAYVEFSSSAEYEKGFALNNTFINGRRINVQYSNRQGHSVLPKKDVVAKNKKLQALSKAGKLAGGPHKFNKKNMRKGLKQPVKSS